MNTMRIAWRNLWRNSRRTGITIVAMSLSTAVLIITYALMLGMMVQMEHSVTDVTVGQVQVHHRNYLKERSLYDTVDGWENILETARRDGIAAAPRAFGFGLLSSGNKSAGVQFWGVDPASEQQIGDMAKNLLKGTYLSGRPSMGVVLGRKLARTLHADVGTELVAVVQASDGSLGNELFHVRGILKSVGENLDRSVAIIDREDFASLFVLPDQYHEIALNSRGQLSPDEVAAKIRSSAGSNEFRTWRQILPGVSDMRNTSSGATMIFLVIFFLAAGLGVLNTLLMATYERIPEFGLLKAIGTSSWRILRDVSAEALVLGILSSILGGIIGTIVSLYFQYFPIDLSAFGEGFNTSGVVISAQWGALLTLRGIIWPIVIMWLVSVLAALYPAAKAARLDPVRALTHV
ncbi:MAG TPA: ABC transporter permease [Deltaproteobacteria bacterium]|nr:ABC transporter permease [Deltaproteobacteria bacterium]